MDFQNNQFQKFLSEVACETDPRYH
jgi:hypothetical protein